MKLYELTSAYRALADVEDENIDDHLANVRGSIEEKAENIAKVISEMESQADAIKVEAERVRVRASAYETRAKKLRGYLKGNLQAADIRKIEGLTHTVQLTKGRPTLSTSDQVTPEWLRTVGLHDYVRVVESIDRNGLSAYLKDHPEAQTEDLKLEQSESLRIK